MAKFDEKTGFLTLPDPDRPKRNLSFRMEQRPSAPDLWSVVYHPEEAGWCPPRLASIEEIAMYTTIRNMHVNRGEKMIATILGITLATMVITCIVRAHQ